MKLSVIISFAAVLMIQCLPQSHSVPSQKNGELQDKGKSMNFRQIVGSFVSNTYYLMIDSIILKMAHYSVNAKRDEMKKTEPILYEFDYPFKIDETDIKGSGKLKNANMTDISGFSTQSLASRKKSNALDYEFFWKTLTANDTHYDFNGKFNDVRIISQGKIDSKISNLKVNGTVTYHKKKGAIIIKKLYLQYKFEKLQLSITGMKVPFISEAQINSALSRKVTDYLRKKERKISARIASKIKKEVNKKLETYTFLNILKLLWDKVNPFGEQTKSDNEIQNFAELTLENIPEA